MSLAPLSQKEIDETITALDRVAHNLWWTWNQGAQEIFQELSPRGWQNLYHNAVAILHEVSREELRARLLDPDFGRRVRLVLQDFDSYMNDEGNVGASACAVTHQQSCRLFFRRIWLSRNVADCRRWPRHSGG